MNCGKYAEAITEFEALNGFRDSEDRITECKYGLAEYTLKSGYTLSAAKLFYQLGDYADSWQRCFAAWGGLSQRSTIAASLAHTIAVKTDGTVIATQYTGYSYDGQCDVKGWSDIAAVSASSHTAGLRSDRTVVSTGYIAGSDDSFNFNYGQCNVNT